MEGAVAIFESGRYVRRSAMDARVSLSDDFEPDRLRESRVEPQYETAG